MGWDDGDLNASAGVGLVPNGRASLFAATCLLL